jgi:hypothetical protein
MRSTIRNKQRLLDGPRLKDSRYAHGTSDTDERMSCSEKKEQSKTHGPFRKVRNGNVTDELDVSLLACSSCIRARRQLRTGTGEQQHSLIQNFLILNLYKCGFQKSRQGNEGT